MFKSGIAAMAIFCALCLAVPTKSDARPGGNPPYPGQPQPGWQLTPEQQAMAQQIFNENYASMQNVREELAYKQSLLDQQLASPNPDRATIEKLSREIGDLRGKMLASRVDVRSKLAQQGLPPDCFGPCWGPGESMPMNNGWGYWRHHRRSGWHHGHGGRDWGRMGCW